MRFLRLKNDGLLSNKLTIDIENLFDNEINKDLNKYSIEQSKYNNKLINELFIHFYRPYAALFHKVSDCSEYDVVGRVSDKDKALLFTINKQLGFIDKEQSNVRYYMYNIRYQILAVLNIFCMSIGMFLYACINSILTNKPSFSRSVIIERTKAASTKLKWFKENVPANILKEKVNLKDEFYSSIRFADLPKLFYHLIKNIAIDYSFLYQYSRQLMGGKITPFLSYYYSKRIPHAALYEFALICIMRNVDIKECYSGNNLDRYGIIEETVCKEHNVKLINIPHGIEYGYVLPHCFTGDVFYSYSEEGAKYLNNQYKTDKFIFSEEVTRNMLKRNCSKLENHIVYFTEPFGIEINRIIIKEIKKLALLKGLEFFIKLHPIDKRENYSDMDVDFISDFDSAITNNICLARKSTVLLEAIYNSSKAIAVMLNESDRFGFEQFPSLRDERILKVYELSALEKFI